MSCVTPPPFCALFIRTLYLPDAFRYDYWPTRFAPDDGLSDARFELENSYPPVDILTDDLD